MALGKRTVKWIIYWNAVFAVVVLGLGASMYLNRFHRFDQLIVYTARENMLDPRLVTSVIWSESRFDPTQVGSSGEIGLMQVTETAAREWADAVKNPSFKKQDLFDPATNLQAGCWYLSRAVAYWSEQDNVRDPLPYALAEYNAGRTNARRWAEQNPESARDFWAGITYPTTKKYIADILQRYRGGV
jgi:soluble lytic murein transglycosylase